MEQSAWLQKKKTNRWIWILAACILTLGAIAVFLRNNPELFGTAEKKEHADSIAASAVHTLPGEHDASTAHHSSDVQTEPVGHVQPDRPVEPVEVAERNSHVAVSTEGESGKHAGSAGAVEPGKHSEPDDGAPPVKNAKMDARADADHRQADADAGSAAGDDHPFMTQKSIALPGINCKLRDRGDFVVLVSIEAFYADDHSRDELLARREELKVMVRNVLSKKTLDQVQTEALRLEIRRSLNTILSNAPVTDIQFKDFRIEKAKEK